jgi:membrane protein DedA with SNARE-associated domain
MSTTEFGWYLSIFAWLFFTGIGIPPVPEEAGILYAAGLNALHPEVRWPIAWAMTGLGIVCADMVLYGVGRRWGVRLFDHRWVKRIMSADRRARIERKFHKHGIKLLLMARFLPPLRTGVFLIAGATRFSFLKFIMADAAYAVVGVGLFFLGGTWLIDLLKRSGHWAFYIVAIPAIGYGLYKYYRYLKRREERPDTEPPASVLEVPVEVIEGKSPGKGKGG